MLALTAALALGGDNRPAWHPVVDSGARLTQLFDQPPAEYSTSPFFVWNGEVTEADIDFYMESYHAQDIRSIFIHPRPGLITEYLSERWFQLVRYTVDKAAKLGMEVWLYDENSYPSGFAGGHVPADMPESYNEGQGLLLRRVTELARGDDRKYKLVLRKDPDGFRDITFQVKNEIGKPGTYYAFELAYYPKRAWHGGYSYVDLLKPGVTRQVHRSDHARLSRNPSATNSAIAFPASSPTNPTSSRPAARNACAGRPTCSRNSPSAGATTCARIWPRSTKRPATGASSPQFLRAVAGTVHRPLVQALV